MTVARRLAAVAGAGLLAGFFLCLPAQAQEAQPGAAAAVRKVGTVKSITGNTLVVKPDSGADANVTVADSTRILRVAPGQTDLKSATPMQLSEVQAGDRVLVRGAPGSAADPLVAATIVVIKATDVSQKQQQQLQDWQRRGAGGIVTAVDAASGSITVASTPTVSYVVKTSPSTGFLRYAADSIKFSDATKGSFDQIKAGDQLRARGNRSADGKEVAAEEVISGTFRNIAGTVAGIDTANSTVTVKDILAKKTVVVKLTAESQMRKLPAQLAQRIAFVLKGSAPGAPGSGNPPAAGSGGNSPGGGPGAGGQRPGGQPDFQQMINRLPAVTLADLQKEDAVMIVSTTGTGASEVTAITLLSGVEQILTASPNGMGAAALLSGWNLSAPGGEGGPQ
ncbi:MAG TPA: DUF5666 domain-containing protein [Candidatus Angelobacter sp.]|nr:DUF5666 domain-containing protein [Candidatus Angelobacter sp.]